MGDVINTKTWEEDVEVTSPFELGPFYVCPLRNRVWRGDEVRPVAPLPMHLLCVLASAPGETFPRDTLLERVWLGVYVSSSAVDRAVCDLRKVFGDDARRAKLIETVRKRGFRLMVRPVPAKPRPLREWTV